MTVEAERNLIVFDVSGFYYGQIIADSAPITWLIHRYNREGESYALDDLDGLLNPVVVASLAVNSFAYDSYDGRLLLQKAQNLSVPTAVIAEESMREKLVVFESAFFIPRISGKVSNNLKTWFATL